MKVEDKEKVLEIGTKWNKRLRDSIKDLPMLDEELSRKIYDDIEFLQWVIIELRSEAIDLRAEALCKDAEIIDQKERVAFEKENVKFLKKRLEDSILYDDVNTALDTVQESLYSKTRGGDELPAWADGRDEMTDAMKDWIKKERNKSNVL